MVYRSWGERTGVNVAASGCMLRSECWVQKAAARCRGLLALEVVGCGDEWGKGGGENKICLSSFSGQITRVSLVQFLLSPTSVLIPFDQEIKISFLRSYFSAFAF